MLNTYNYHGLQRHQTKQLFFSMLPFLQAIDHYKKQKVNFSQIIIFRFNASQLNPLIKDMQDIYNSIAIDPTHSSHVGAVGFFDQRNNTLGKYGYKLHSPASQGHLVVFPRSNQEHKDIIARYHIHKSLFDKLRIIKPKQIAYSTADLMIKMNHMFEMDGFGRHSWKYEPIVFPCAMRSLDPDLIKTHSQHTNQVLSSISKYLQQGITIQAIKGHVSFQQMLNNIP